MFPSIITIKETHKGKKYLQVGLGAFQLFFKSFHFVLERGPSARSFRSHSFFSIVPFSFDFVPFRSVLSRRTVILFRFVLGVLFQNNGIILECSVCSPEKTIVPQERRPALFTSYICIALFRMKTVCMS